MSSLDDLFKQSIQHQELDKNKPSIPPVEKWNPPLSGDIDIVIKSSGQWLHEGDPINRQALVDVFASILKKEGEDYFLVTPVEKWRVQVEDAPLLIVESRIQKNKENQPSVWVKTATGDEFTISTQHPLVMRGCENEGKPNVKSSVKPYVLVRHQLEALVHRNVFYQWQDAVEQVEGRYGLWSDNIFFPLEPD